VLSAGVEKQHARPTPQKKRDVSTDIRSDFETNTTEGWQPRIGNEVVSVSSVEKYSGSSSLFTSGRQAAYDGCKINVSGSMTTGSEYRISLWAKLAAGSNSTHLKITLQRSLAGNTTYHPVAAKAVSAGNWVRLSAVYDYKLAHDSLWLYVESASGTPSFYIDDFSLENLPPLTVQADIPSLRGNLAPHFSIGAAVWQGDITGAHSQLLNRHFNSITAEDAMKWEHIHPTESAFNFAPADALVDYAVANGMQVRGHTLIWHNQVPDWVFHNPAGQSMTPTPENKALLLQRLDAHIRAVVAHFGDKVYAWDVVNEAIDPAQPDGLRRNKWYEICGPEYIERAFLAAREAAPAAKLYLNDFETTVPSKRTAILNLIQRLRSRGIPINGIGHQMHSDMDSPTAAEVIETINLFSAIPGIDNHITELDMSIYTNANQAYEIVPEAVLLKQGYRYRELFAAFRQLQGKISSVTFWGKADDHTWLSTYPITRLEAPLPFDDRLQAKPAYWGVVDPQKLTVEISGRVISDDGRGLRGVTVTLISNSGVRRTVLTSSLGYFNFAGVWAFEDYTLSGAARRYRFSSKSIYPSGNVVVDDFVGLE
jgi:endo-1,4-beta-xylanase